MLRRQQDMRTFYRYYVSMAQMSKAGVYLAKLRYIEHRITRNSKLGDFYSIVVRISMLEAILVPLH
jgi:hypothetical protein